MSADRRTGVIDAAVKVLGVLDVLWDHMAEGLSTSQVASAARTTPSQATRALQTLEAAGYAERITTTGRWRPAVRIARHATAIHRSIDRLDTRNAELRDRVGPLT